MLVYLYETSLLTWVYSSRSSAASSEEHDADDENSEVELVIEGEEDDDEENGVVESQQSNLATPEPLATVRTQYSLIAWQTLILFPII